MRAGFGGVKVELCSGKKKKHEYKMAFSPFVIKVVRFFFQQLKKKVGIIA